MENTDRADKLKAACGHLSPFPVPGAAGTHSRHQTPPSMSPRAASAAPAAHLPVASVLVMLGLSHLDRLFDYEVGADQDADAVPGARVRVRFAGRLVDGFVVDRLASSDHTGKLGRLDRWSPASRY